MPTNTRPPRGSERARKKLAGFNQVTWTQQNGIRGLVETKQRAHTYRAPKKISCSVTFLLWIFFSLCETFPPYVWSYARLTSGKNFLRQAGWWGVSGTASKATEKLGCLPIRSRWPVSAAGCSANVPGCSAPASANLQWGDQWGRQRRGPSQAGGLTAGNAPSGRCSGL